MSISIPDLIKANEVRWTKAKYSPLSSRLAASVAKRLVAAKDPYLAVEKDTGVPWYVVAVIHEREASQNWHSNIAQGDPWNQVSHHEPKGRGPFSSWHEAALDALWHCPPHAAKWKDWSAGGTLTILELYNGEGYENYHHMASPYLWGGSDQYTRGKYVSDGKFDPSAVDKQLGCAIMLSEMAKLDNSVVMK